MRGLIAPLERKNGWQLAEAVGDATPDGVQELLSRVHRDADAVRDDLRSYVVEHLGDANAVLVLDETGFLKKGTKSVGVQRQYSGTAGRIEPCQIGLFLGYASRRGQALIDRALYLPERWTADAARRAAAHVPQDIVFTTKPKLGLAMVERACAAGVASASMSRFAWVSGDSVYGADYRLRRGIEAHGRGYVLGVTSGQRWGFTGVDARVADLPPEAWQRLSAGEGMKGPRLYDWTAILSGNEAPTGFRRKLLVLRSIAEPDEVAYYLTYAPAERRRWPNWPVWLAHAGPSRACLKRPRVKSALMSMRCDPGPVGTATSCWPCSRMPRSACCASTPSGGEDPRNLAELLPVTVPEVRRLLWRLVWAQAPQPDAVLQWSDWRRRHQQRARRCHWHRRTRRHETRL